MIKLTDFRGAKHKHDLLNYKDFAAMLADGQCFTLETIIQGISYWSKLENPGRTNNETEWRVLYQGIEAIKIFANGEHVIYLKA